MRTTIREEPKVTETRAGVAVSRTASGNPLLTLTLVTGPPDNGVFADPIEHELQELTPATLAAALSRILTTPTSIVLSLPIGLPDEERYQYRTVVGQLPDMELWGRVDHTAGYIQHIIEEFKDLGEVAVVFLDLTTHGQVTGRLSSVEGTSYIGEKLAVAGTAEEVIDKLLKPPIYPPTHGIYILCPPGGPGFESHASALKLKIPEAIVRSVTIAEVSRGAAEWRERNEGISTSVISCAFFTPLPMTVALANGRRVECVPRNFLMPLKRTTAFTTALENQASATLEFFYGDTSIGKVVLQGIVATRPRIQVTISCEEDGETSVCVEEVGSDSKVEASLGLLQPSKEEVEAYVRAHEGEGSCPYGGDSTNAPLEDVLGELPE